MLLKNISICSIAMLAAFITIFLVSKEKISIDIDYGIFITYFTFSSGFIFTSFIFIADSKIISKIKNEMYIQYEEIIGFYKLVLFINFSGVAICGFQIMFKNESLVMIWLFISILVYSFILIIKLINDTINLIKIGIK